jgi:4-azaleucine resistance transporter AzlC
MGYIPIGFALGVMAADIGLKTFETGLMSFFVYAGSAQFIAVNLLGMGISPLPIIATTLFVNLRHVLFSASLSPYFKEINQKLISFISFYITDESFAVSITDVKEKNLAYTYFIGLYVTSYLSWILSTMIGSAFCALIPDTKALGFDFALPGMFLALLCMQLKDWKTIAVALIAGALSILFVFAIPGNWNVILAAVIAAVLGVLLDK